MKSQSRTPRPGSRPKRSAEGVPKGGRGSPNRARTPARRQAATGPETTDQVPETQKLHKMLAQAGLGSRRDMEAAMEAGRVTVNGQVATLGTRVGPEDVVRFDRRLVKLPFEGQRVRILLYHKPEGEIVTREDPEHRPIVFEKLPRIRQGKWLAVGRLDFNTSGLLIFTNSGDLANRLTHPRFEVEREYAVRILGRLSDEQMRLLTSGIDLEDGPARFDLLADQGGEGVNHWYRAILKEGRKREVRRMFEAIGLTVSRLMRVRFGIIGLPPRLKRGQVLELDREQVGQVLAWVGMQEDAG